MNSELEKVKNRIDSFLKSDNLMLWCSTTAVRLYDRFSQDGSVEVFWRKVGGFGCSKDVYIAATDNDVILVIFNDVWDVALRPLPDPNEVYYDLMGEDSLYDLRWCTFGVPTEMVEDLLSLFDGFEIPKRQRVTVALACRDVFEQYKGKDIYFPNPFLYKEKKEWVLKMQWAIVDGKEVPPCPNIPTDPNFKWSEPTSSIFDSDLFEEEHSQLPPTKVGGLSQTQCQRRAGG